MASALGSAARVDVDMPRVVLLSPGSGSETAYDQGFLATLLGFPLVEADDLSVRGGRLWIRGSARREEVDVVLRRVDADYCDPLELRSDSQLGIAGLVEATRRGAVRMANPLGAGVLENAGLVAFLPEVAHRLLGEDLLLPSATTWWCGDSPARSHVLANLDRLVVKPVARGPVLSARFGWELDAAGRDDLRREVEARPWAWVGQEPVPMSTAPVVTPGGLAPGRLVLRTFGVTDSEHHHVMPGGLARVNTDASSSLVSSMSGAIAKDVWVLSDDTAGVGGWRGATPEAQPTLVRLQRRVAVAPRVADNLYWVGRYAERAEGTARLLRVADDLAADHAQRPGTPGATTMEVMVQAAAAVTGVQPVEGQGPVDHLRAMVGDAGRTGTVAHACHRLVLAAESVRDQLSQDIWHILSRLDRTLGRPASPRAPLRPQLDNVLESLLAVAGVVHESMVRDQTWGFLDGGIRVERAQHDAGPAAGDAHLRASAGHRRAGHRGGAGGQREHHHPPPAHDVRRGTRLAVALGHLAAAARRRQPDDRSPSRWPASARPCAWPATPPSWTAATRWPPCSTPSTSTSCARATGPRSGTRWAPSGVRCATCPASWVRATSAASLPRGCCSASGAGGADGPPGTRRLHPPPLRGAAPDDVHLRGCRRHRLLRARLPRPAPDARPSGCSATRSTSPRSPTWSASTPTTSATGRRTSRCGPRTGCWR